MTVGEAQEAIRQKVPRVQMTAFYALAVTVGFAPFAYVTGSWPGILIAFALVSITAFFTTRDRDTYLAVPPSSGEIALALLGYSAGGALCGFLGISLLWFLGYGAEAAGWIFGFSVSQSVHWWFELASLAVALLLLLAIVAVDASEILSKLYPAASGRPSPFAEFLFQPKRRRGWYLMLVSAAVIVVVVAVSQYFHALSAQTWAIWLEIAFLLANSELWDLKFPDRSASSPEPLVEQVQLLLQAAGYQVRIYPATGKGAEDALIGLVDFLAIRPDRAIAGCVTDRQDPKYLRAIAVNLQTAVWGLQDRLSPKERAKIEIEPVIVVVGGSPSLLDDEPEISASIDRMYVRIIRTPSLADLMEIVGDPDAQSKGKNARELFDPPLEWSEASESLIAPSGFARP
jgi:hypothetical protein